MVLEVWEHAYYLDNKRDPGSWRLFWEHSELGCGEQAVGGVK